MKRPLAYPTLALIALALTLLCGCQREVQAPLTDSPADYASFFRTSSSSPIVRQLVRNLANCEETRQNAPMLYRTYGKPLWDHALVVADASRLQVLVPMEEPRGRHITSIWGFDVRDHLIAHSFLENDQKSDGYQKLGWLFAALEQEIYGPTGKTRFSRTKRTTKAYLEMEVCYDVFIEFGEMREYAYSKCYTPSGGGIWISETPAWGGGIIPQDPNGEIPHHGGNAGADDPIPNPEVDTKRPLTPQEIQKVNQVKEEVYSRGCGAMMAYNMVNANWGNYKFVIDPNLNGKGLAAYYPSTKTFGFLNENQITSKNITEELLHATQDLTYENGTSQYSNIGYPNIEFEAKILVEVNNVVNGMCCINAYFLQGLDLIEFKEDLRGWIQNGKIDQNQYFHWLNIWYNDTDNPYYRKGVVKGDLSPTLLNKFLNEKLDCIKPILQ